MIRGLTTMKTSTAGYVLRSSVIAVMLLCLLAPAREGLCEEAALSSERYMGAVTRFADTVIEHGRDTYGEKKTPVFVDGLHVETLSPPLWKGDGYQSYIMSNFASQQGLMRTLDGLTELTGDTRYRQAAEDATRYTLKNFTSPNGLLFWGGHSAWDLLLDRPVGEEDGRKHELRNHRPYFQIMWRVNKDATRKLMETIWAGHIVDWQRLDYERHCKMMTEYTPKWDAEFREDIDVPYPAWFGNMSFANVTPTLLHTSVSLAILANHAKGLTWSRRLAYRWEQTKHPETGLSGSQLTYRTRDRAQSALNHVHPLINEAKIVFASSARYRTYPLSLMQSAETLIAVGARSAEIGKEFIGWACDDLKVYARESYQPDKGVFIALMTDGTPIQGEKTRKKRYFTPRSFRL